MSTPEQQTRADSMVIRDLNREIHGTGSLRKLQTRLALRDLKAYAYLARRLQFRSLYNFFYTKVFVPTGEGSFLCLHTGRIRNPDRVPLPNYIELEPTTVCDKRCYICEYVHWPHGEQVRRHLRLEEFRHIADQLPQVRWINITGEGSAFLNRNYPKMIQFLYARDRTSVWFVDHLADDILDLWETDVLPYIHGIYVSMDAATQETYEKIKVGCKYNTVLKNLQRILEYKRRNRTPFPYLTFRYIILPENVHEMPLFLDLLNSLAKPHEWGGSGCYVEFTGLLYFDAIRDQHVSQIPRNVIEELLKRKRGINFIFSHAEEEKNPPIEQCAAWLEPYIMLPGYVMPCCAVMMSNRRPFLRQYAFGNVLRDHFVDIWNSPYYTKFRRILNDPDSPVPMLCAGCRAYQTKARIQRHGVWDVYQDPDVPHQRFDDLDVTIQT